MAPFWAQFPFLQMCGTMSEPSDPIRRLNAALEDRYAIERELGEGGMAVRETAGMQ